MRAFVLSHGRRVASLGLLVSSILTVGGCSDMGTPLKPTPVSSVSATSLQFGTVALGQFTTRSVVVSNFGTGRLHATASVACPEFVIESGGGAFTLVPGATRTIVVRFTPNAVGTFTCTLDLGADTSPVSLDGMGAHQTPGARSLVLPDTLAFGVVRLGEGSTASFDVLSFGTAPLIVDVTSPCAGFKVVTGGGPNLVLPGEKITVVVSFEPTQAGAQECVISVGPGVAEVGVSGSAFSVSFTEDIQPILYENCSFCHYEFADHLDHDTYPYIRQLNRIVPYDLDNSILYNRIANTGRFGQLMPQGGPQLPAANIDLVRRWILEGALDN